MPDLNEKALIADLEARVEALEKSDIPRIPHEHLATLYLDAAYNHEDSEALARAFVRQFMSLDVRSLLSMAQQTSDPFPWQPLLYKARALSAQYAEAVIAVEHLRKIAEQLLAVQGLYPLMQVDEIGEYIPLHIRTFLTIRSQKDRKADE